VVVKEAELDGERVLVIGDEEIYAAGVVFESCAVRGGEVVIDALGYEADLKHALGFVVRDERGAEDLSQSALGVAAEDVHLPEAILGGDVALGGEEVVLSGCVDVGDAVGVAADNNRGIQDVRGEAGEVHVAVELGQSGFGCGAEPEDGGCAGGEKQNEEGEGGEEENARPAAVARASGRGAYDCLRR
jgi:hypothetical protein